MKRQVTRNSSYILIGLGAALGLVLAGGGTTFAAGVEVLPSQQAPQLPASKPMPFAPQQEHTIPPRLPMGMGSNTREIPLPKVFRGCWSGSVPAVDTIRPLQEGEPPIVWLTKLYRLCYRQSGINGKWELTFADSSVADRDRATDQRQVIKVKAVTGADEVIMSSYLHFRAESIGMFGTPNGNINTIDELADLHCRMTPDRDAIEVQASVLVESNGEPYAEMTWHTRLERTSGSD